MISGLDNSQSSYDKLAEVGMFRTRYFYHYGYFQHGYWNTTEKLIQVPKEGYDRIVAEESRIKERTGKKYWHRPIKVQGALPEGKEVVG